MIHTQSIQLLSIFKKTELKQFGEYVASPIFNKNKTIIKFFSLLKKGYPEFPSEFFTKEKIAQKLFPAKKGNAQKVALRKLNSQLSKLLKDFLVFQFKNKNAFEKEVDLLYIFNERKNTKLFDNQLLKVNTKIIGLKELGGYFQKFRIENVKCEQNIQQPSTLKNNDLVKVLQKFDVYWITKKLQYCCTLLSRKYVLAIPTEILLFEELLTSIQEKKFLQEIPLIKIYYTTILLYKSNDRRYLNELKNCLLKYAPILTKETIHAIYMLAINYCIHQLSAGNNQYYTYILELYKDMLKNDLLILDTYLSPQDFKNIVSLAAKTQQFDWAKEFIKQYQTKLPLENQENMSWYTLGILAFFEEDYSTALTHLNQLNLLNFFYHLDTESLLIKTYYELEQEQVLESKLEAFRKYLHRHPSMSESNKETYYNFIKLTKRLMHWKEKVEFAKYDTKAANSLVHGLEKLKQDISAYNPLVNKQWLLKKVNAL